MRGKPSFQSLAGIALRITPADAGKTIFSCFYPINNQDHPRGCGENIPQLVDAGMQLGSPPRMRGKHPQNIHVSRRIIITPADAGKTHRHNVAQCIIRDHPRGCGENQGSRRPESVAPGSPPRMRGKLLWFGTQNPSGRITPADAGKTLAETQTICA